MRLAFILRFLTRFHLLVGLVLLVPAGVGAILGAPLLRPWLIPAIAAVSIAAVLRAVTRALPRAGQEGLRRREGFLLVALSWSLIILYGSVPFVLSGAVPDLTAALFESASGFTTTGATVITEIEALPPSVLFWRAFSHWLGGMGIIVLAVAILPELAVGGMQLFSAESSGLGVDKLAPRIAQTAKRLWALYVALTAIEVLLLLLGGLGLFDAVTHAFATTATGGFSTKSASIAHFDSLYVDTVITAFMFLSGINFALQYRVLRGEWKRLFYNSELRLYAGFMVGGIALVTWDLTRAGFYEGVGESLRYGSFQVVSLFSTTGFGTADFDQWPTFSKSLLVVLMTIGGCAGSTAGGLKVVRLCVVLKHAVRECQRLLYPRMVRPVRLDRKAVDEDILFSILGFFLLYMLVLAITLCLLTALRHEDPMDLLTATTATISCLNSVGPGLERVGPVENYAFVHPAGKLMLSFCMVLGRLEIYTLLVVLMPRFWRRC